MPEIITGQPMEEILASIKRIIAEDAPLSLGPPTLGNPPEKADAQEEEVLELGTPTLAAPSAAEPAQAPPGWRTATEEPGDPALQADPAPVAEPAEYFRGQPVTSTPPADYVTSASTLAAEQEPTVTPAAPTPVAHEPMSEPHEGLLSASAEAASRQALAALSTLTIDPHAAPNTLDGMVREMVRPMVKDWLDQNLPPLVEQIVAREIKRLARG